MCFLLTAVNIGHHFPIYTLQKNIEYYTVFIIIVVIGTGPFSSHKILFSTDLNLSGSIITKQYAIFIDYWHARWTSNTNIFISTGAVADSVKALKVKRVTLNKQTQDANKEYSCVEYGSKNIITYVLKLTQMKWR